jgi:hypothetical protein
MFACRNMEVKAVIKNMDGSLSRYDGIEPNLYQLVFCSSMNTVTLTARSASVTGGSTIWIIYRKVFKFM